VGVVIILIAGCGGQDTSKSEIKRGRLIAAKITAENRQLKKQSEQLKKELENQKELLARRLQEKKASEEHLQKSGEDRMKNLLKAATEENSKLRQTTEELKAQVKQLEEELEKIKGSKKFKEWGKETQKNIQELSENAIRDFEEIAKLREENENLKTEITELKKELETRKGPTPLPHTD
jgi:chromosome segregation ATPase